MYTKDKSNRITLRLNDGQFAFVKQSSDVLGVSPSEFLRMVVNVCMASSTVAEEKAQAMNEKEIESISQTIKEGLRRENEKTSNDN